jgi:MFS transporter, ACS family, pantothenate transporter
MIRWATLTCSRMVANAGLGPQFFNLWLKAEKFSVVQVNTIPTAGSALQVLFAFTYGTIADLTGRRMLVANIASVFLIFVNTLLAIWNIPIGLKWFAFLCSFSGQGVQPLIIVSNRAKRP